VSAYRKELRSTIGFGIVFVLLGHTGLWAVMLGTDNSVRLLGLPAHYTIAIVLGSLGVFVWSVIWCIYANRLEDEIEAENAGRAPGAVDARRAAAPEALAPARPALAEAAK
jgi:hypothetical protein